LQRTQSIELLCSDVKPDADQRKHITSLALKFPI
jgi:hypothetical protein